jgi:pyruvate,orthophosphate dikinase
LLLERRLFMLPNESFASRALTVNLARTRSRQVVLSEDERRFLELSSSYRGIHSDTENFLGELHHPYPNYALILEGLRNLALKHSWLYISHAEAVWALRVLNCFFKHYLYFPLAGELRERAVRTLMELARLIIHAPDNVRLAPVVEDILCLAMDDLERHEEILIISSSFLKSCMDTSLEGMACAEKFPALLRKALEKNLEFWEKSLCFLEWFRRYHPEVSPAALKTGSLLEAEFGIEYFTEARQRLHAAKSWKDLCSLTDFKSLQAGLRKLAERFDSALERVYFLFFLASLPGFRMLREDILRDLNRTFREFERDGMGDGRREGESFLDDVFGFFERLRKDFQSTILDCIRTMGGAIYASGNRILYESFIDRVIRFGFVKPGRTGVGADWEILADPNHVKNIRVWLELVEQDPPATTRLLSALLVNLKLGGVFISDTDLFQQDITNLLNAKIASCYKMVRHVASLFPVYFSELGAEGELRELTTAIDEISGRRDLLIHFLRKQVHAESNNTHIELAEKIFLYWHDGNKTALREHLPTEIFESLSPEGKWYDGTHRLAERLCSRLRNSPPLVFSLPPRDVLEALEGMEISPEDEEDRKRLALLFRIHRLLREKYTLDSGDVLSRMRRLNRIPAADIDRLEELLAGEEPEAAIRQIYSVFSRLNEIILDPEISEGEQDIYHKRHIAAGIPSMYGRYREPKFEALGIFFRLENVVNTLMEKITGSLNTRYITARTLNRIAHILDLYREGIELSGIRSESFNSHLRMLQYGLTASGFSISQFTNLFHFMLRDINGVIKDYFLRPHDANLKIAIPRLFRRDEDRDADPREIEQFVSMKAEQFYRETISSTFLLNDLDNFLGKVLNTLRAMEETLAPQEIRMIMSYDPERMISSIDLPASELESRVFLGAKGYFLKQLHGFGFPVPPGFIITTELFRYRPAIHKLREAQLELYSMIFSQLNDLEHKTGLKYGDPSGPLLLSVRSGSAISMPGAMNTFLNVGLNDQIVENLCKNPLFAWTGWDCYRRFLQTWGMASGINRDEFDRVILRFKEASGFQQKSKFPPSQMRQIALAYKEVLSRHDVTFEDDPRRQLLQAVSYVMDSWESDRARAYRKQMKIAEEWGTAVIIQRMVFGNIGGNSGTGVVFTREPFGTGEEVCLYGDFNLCSQGEDVVSGLVYPLPISERQRSSVHPPKDVSLEKDFPEVYQNLLKYARELLEIRRYGHQEIEFTFESADPGDLYILQTRDYLPPADDRVPIFKEGGLETRAIGRGIGIGGGAMNGIVVFDREDLEDCARRFPESKRILVRPDTVPDDINMIFDSDGLLTSRGGVTSHAALTATRLGKTCVVNCETLKVLEQEKKCFLAGELFKTGDPIAIDGRVGNIFRGHFPITYESIDAY